MLIANRAFESVLDQRCDDSGGQSRSDEINLQTHSVIYYKQKI